MSDSGLLYDTFMRYLNRGIAARDAGDFASAKTQLLLAAETLNKLADVSSGELKKRRQERVISILETVETLGTPPASAGGAKHLPEAGRAENGERREDTETEWISAKVPEITFKDIAGVEDVKRAARDMIIDPFIYPDLYKKHGLKPGGGIMMYGLPGTGKTSIAKAIAGEVKGKFYIVRNSDIYSKWVGEAERNIRNLFDTARAQERAVILFDDCDAIGGGRNNDNDVTGKKVLTELLVQMDGADSDNKNLLLLAATNAPWNMDGALTRPGRFDRFLEVTLPDVKAREFLFKRELKAAATDNIDIAELAYLTEGYSGADIVGICNEAKRLSLQRDKDARRNQREENSKITQEDLSKALRNTKSSIRKADRERLEKYKTDNSLA